MVIAVGTLDDPRLRDYQLTARPEALRRAGLFVAEGRLVVVRLFDHPRVRVRSLLLTTTALAGMSPLAVPADVPVYVVEQPTMDGLVGFNIHRGCLALCERPPARTLDPAALDRADLVLVLEQVSNPDNLGGLFRNAAAFGVALVVLGPHCADPLYRKTLRTSMGAALAVEWVHGEPWPAVLDVLRAHGFRLVALTPAADAHPLHELATPDRLALVLGAEGPGLSPDTLAACDERRRIVTSDRVDSLNVSAAAAIALHHARTPPRP